MLHKVYSGKEVAGIIDAQLVSKIRKENILIKDILIDSRKLISAKQTVFFALISKHNDGHKYIHTLYKRGIRMFVISNEAFTIKKYPDASFFMVKNTLRALQQLAAYHRKQFNIPVIGITGSNGKTIIKEWLYQLLSPDVQIVRSPKSYNSQIGVPLSVWQINKTHDLAIFEAGISEPNEMENLQKVIEPEIGIFTNIGDAHSENFLGKPHKVGEKLKLFVNSKNLIYCSDHKEIKEVMIKSEILKKVNAFSWGKEETNDLIIKSTAKENNTTTIMGVYDRKEISITIPFIDHASIENASHCWATMLFMGYDNEVIAERMRKLHNVAMRLELKEGINNCSIVNDSYNSDVNSLTIAIDFISQQNQHKEKVVILSDILQTGIPVYELYTTVNNLLKQKGITKLIGIGQDISSQRDKFDLDAVFFTTTKEFLANYPLSNFSNQTILLKGARIFEFEQINKLLQQKFHETILEINLNNLVHNLNYFKSLLKPGTRIMGMVKAFSYGSGSFEIANVLQYHNVDYLAVAYADEGVELRKAGINIPIMVMNPEENAFDTMIKYQLEPEIFSFRALRLLEKSIRNNALPQNKPVKIHIKLDTGMHRLGFAEEEIEELIKKVKKNKLLLIQSVFSHLATSDKPEFDYFTKEQISNFERMSEPFSRSFSHEIIKHIVNTAGIKRFPEAHFDMVRLGIGLYGIEDKENDLNNVVTFKSSVSQIKQVKKGESVSYNRSWMADKDTTIGIVAVGYADGLMRNLGNGKTSLWIKGQEVPILGDICMDMCIIDLTGIKATEGDEVIIFNDKHKVCELAEKAGTISYEILSRISTRVKRVYYYE
jgi:alanine racemase